MKRVKCRSCRFELDKARRSGVCSTCRHFLEGPGGQAHLSERLTRIRRYQKLAAKGLPLFGGK